MKTKVVIGCIVAASALFATETQSAGAPAPSSLLIRYHVTSTEALAGATSTGDSLIFRDGLIIENFIGGDGHCLVVRSTALIGMLKELQHALSSNNVGFQSGNCASQDAPGDYQVERQVTWFGRGERQNTYKIGTALGALCPSGTLEIDSAIQSLLTTAKDKHVAHTCP